MVILCLRISAQCPCQDCPIFVPDVGTESSCIDISGLTNSTINSGGQLICEVSLNFEHEWIGDVNIALIAPDGSFIDLVWEGAFGGSTGEFWDVTFLSCADAPLPDPGMPDVFPSQGWPNSEYFRSVER